MASPPIHSEAFQSAALRSERFRILGMLGFLIAAAIIVGLRHLTTDSAVEQSFVLKVGGLIVLLAVYEAQILRVVGRNQLSGLEPPVWLWGVNLIVETSFPTLLLFLIATGSDNGPYSALVAPGILLYPIFIILSTLKLSPRLCFLTGLLSTGGYLLVVVFVFSTTEAPEFGVYSLPLYMTYAATIFLSGAVASGVAGQIRSHVVAAMKEAETREKMERIKQDLNIARTIQQGLLPESMPTVDGFQIAGWNKPADETGGDYYDWQAISNGCVAISLADVSGHGIGPALVTAACRAYARAAFPTVSSIGEEMDKINALLVEDLPSDRFITFVVAVIDPATSQIQLLSAGHSPLLFFTAADGKVENFAAHGIPFGLMAGIPYGDPQVIDMAKGDMLVLITDGFTEWMNSDDEEYGEDRISEVLQDARDLTPDEIIVRLYDAVREFGSGVEQADDLTAVIIKRV